MLTRLRHAAVPALLLVLTACAADPGARPRWNQSPDADLGARASFGWADRAGQPPVTILDNQIRDAVRAGLLDKGYVESSDEPDFLVAHETVEQETLEQGSPVRIGIGLGSRGGNVGASVGTSMDVGTGERLKRRMVILIRALEPEDRREAWVGTTAAVPERPDGRAIDRAVSGVLRGFPNRDS